MRIAFELLLPSVLVLRRVAPAAAAAGGRCTDLNYRAADLQSDDACALLRTVLGGGDVFPGHTAPDVEADVEATCGFRGGGGGDDRPAATCVEGVAEVVAEMERGGCEVTGGATVERFIDAVGDNREGFAFLTRLACRRAGRCIGDIRRSIEYCYTHPAEEDCMSYAPCDCAADLFSAHHSFSANGDGDLLRLEDAIAARVEGAGKSCKCGDVNRRAAALELSGPCALAGKIVQGRDLLAGDTAAIADTCGGDRTCVDDAVAVLDEFIEFDCDFAEASATFLYGLQSGREDFGRIADFACDNACYTTFRTCHHYYNNDAACLESTSCNCQRDFVNFVKSLSADSRRDLLKIDAAAIDAMEAGIDTCECNRLNRGVTSAVNQGRCALHGAIIREGHMFAGTSSDIQSACPRLMSCVEDVTESVARVIGEGCEIRLGSDAMARVVYNLNNSSEWEEITGFVCDVDRSAAAANATGGGCYDEIKAVVEACKNDPAADCTASATPECLESFLGTVGRLSDGARGGLLGIDASTIGRIEAWDVVESTASPTARPTTQAPTSGASIRAWLTATVVASAPYWLLNFIVYY